MLIAGANFLQTGCLSYCTSNSVKILIWENWSFAFTAVYSAYCLTDCFVRSDGDHAAGYSDGLYGVLAAISDRHSLHRTPFQHCVRSKHYFSPTYRYRDQRASCFVIGGNRVTWCAAYVTWCSGRHIRCLATVLVPWNLKIFASFTFSRRFVEFTTKRVN